MKRCFYFMMGLFLATLLILPGFGVPHASEKPIEFRWVSLMAIATLDPAQSSNWPSYATAVNLYDTLVFPDVKKGYIPWIAKSWKVSEDGLRYTFYLNKGIPFHDGTEITAEDVVFSMDRMLTLKESSIGPHFKFIKPGTTKVLDKYTVEFNLSERSPKFLVALCIFKILNKKVILKNIKNGAYGEFGDYGKEYLLSHDAGSGPYMAVEHKIGNYFKMKRYREYSLEQWKPNSIDIVTIHTIPEAVTEVTKLKAGELEMGEWSLPAKALREFQQNKNFTVKGELADVIWTCVMNNKKKPLDDVYVRKAVAHAFDVELVMNKILVGGKRARGPLPESMSSGCTDIVTYPFDLEKARAMLKKSKYSAEELQKFEMTAGNLVGSTNYMNIFLMLTSNLRKIGLNVKMETTTWANICQHARKPETAFHFAMLTQSAEVPHPLQYLVYYTKEGWGAPWPAGGMYYSNPKVEEAIQKANDSLNVEEQKRYYCEAQRLIAEDSPTVFSNTGYRLMPFWRYVKGYKFPVGAEFFHQRFNLLTIDTEDPLFKKNHGW